MSRRAQNTILLSEQAKTFDPERSQLGASTRIAFGLAHVAALAEEKGASYLKISTHKGTISFDAVINELDIRRLYRDESLLILGQWVTITSYSPDNMVIEGVFTAHQWSQSGIILNRPLVEGLSFSTESGMTEVVVGNSLFLNEGIHLFNPGDFNIDIYINDELRSFPSFESLSTEWVTPIIGLHGDSRLARKLANNFNVAFRGCFLNVRTHDRTYSASFVVKTVINASHRLPTMADLHNVESSELVKIALEAQDELSLKVALDNLESVGEFIYKLQYEDDEVCVYWTKTFARAGIDLNQTIGWKIDMSDDEPTPEPLTMLDYQEANAVRVLNVNSPEILKKIGFSKNYRNGYWQALIYGYRPFHPIDMTVQQFLECLMEDDWNVYRGDANTTLDQTHDSFKLALESLSVG